MHISEINSNFASAIRGVAQLVAYCVRDAGVASSSLVTPTSRKPASRFSMPALLLGDWTEIRLCGYAVEWLYGFTVMRFYGCAVIRLYGFTVIRFYGFTVVRLCGCAVLRFYGYAVIRFYGFTVVRLCGCAVEWG